MTLNYLLDTSTLSWTIAPQPDETLVRKVTKNSAECAIAAPVWHELTYGCRRLPRGRRRTELENYLRDVVQPTFPILPYDHAAAAWHGAERARLERAGRSAPYVDGQIAAVANVNGLTIVTTNRKDFRPFKDLRVEDWSKRRSR